MKCFKSRRTRPLYTLLYQLLRRGAPKKTDPRRSQSTTKALNGLQNSVDDAPDRLIGVLQGQQKTVKRKKKKKKRAQWRVEECQVVREAEGRRKQTRSPRGSSRLHCNLGEGAEGPGRSYLTSSLAGMISITEHRGKAIGPGRSSKGRGAGRTR